MFRREEKTEISFEDIFFDDMIAEIEKLRAIAPKGNYDAGWNAGVKHCIFKLYSFFGRGNIPTRIINGFVSYVASDEDKKALLFDDLVKEIMKMRIPRPSNEEHEVWNSAVQVCLVKLCNFFGQSGSMEGILNLFDKDIKKTETKAALTEEEQSNPNESLTGNPTENITKNPTASHVSSQATSQATSHAASHDPINHPDYYCDGGIETLDYIMAKKLDFLLGQVVKYVSRAGKKNPAKEIEDLKKARFYLDWKINLLKGKP